MKYSRLLVNTLITTMILLIAIYAISKDDIIINNSLEEIAEKLITDIFTISYDDAVNEYEYKHKESSKEDDVDRIDYIYRNDVFNKYFNEEGYEKFYNNRYNLIYHIHIREHKFDVFVNSIELDLRNTSDENTKACFFSVEYEFVFLDEKKESISMKTDGEMTLKKENDNWLVDYVGFKIRQLDLK